MNILLINPPDDNIIECYKYNGIKKNVDVSDFGTLPPLGLLYILAYLEKHSTEDNLFLIDCISEKISYNDLEKKILDIKPDIVGITSYSISLIDVIKTAQTVRKQFPKAHINMGGHHAMAFPKEAVDVKEFDSVILGEGEEAFYELVKALSQNKPIENITGVYTKKSAEKLLNSKSNVQDDRFLYSNPFQYAYIENLDFLPFPARKYLKHVKCYSIVGVSEKIITLITSRGCPYHCIMCDVPYKKYRTRSIKNVVDEIEECVKDGFNEFKIYDDMFNITPERVMDFSQEIIRRNLKIVWDFRGRVNTVTRQSLEIAKKSGLRMISCGVETGTDEGLSFIQKGTTTEQIKYMFKVCRELKIKTVADFIIGFPFEKTESDIKKNLDFCFSIKPDYLILSVLMLYPGTPIYQMALEKNIINKNRWIDFCHNPSKDFYIDFWTEFFTREQLIYLQQKALGRFYLRFSYFMRSIINITTFEEFKLKFRGLFRLIKNRI